jgi:hypothetical protein
MGGDYYDREIEETTNVGSNTNYSSSAYEAVGKHRGLHPTMDAKRLIEEGFKCTNQNPIVFALDVTGSMGEWTRVS